MRVHWFSPLLPDATDVGHFTARVLRELTKLCTLTVWTETKNVKAELLPGIEVRHFLPAKLDFASLNAEGAIVYNIGNNGPFHAGIYEVSQQVPGIVLLHEADLQGLFAFLWLNRYRDASIYMGYLRDHYGALGEAFGSARLRGIPLDDLAHRFPIASPAIANALGVICHTRQTAQLANEQNLPVLQLQLPFLAGSELRSKNRHGPIRLVQFGYLNPFRKLDEIFAALAQHKSKSSIRFEIFGQLWDATYVANRIKALGLQEIVSLRGFVEEDVLDEAISASDLVFNMRYPTIGEASGTQLRIWKNAAPAMVTDNGWFKELPEDTVLKIPPGNEVAAVGQILDDLFEDRFRYDRVGARGREQLIRQHSPADYAAKVFRFLHQFETFQRRSSITRLTNYLRAKRDFMVQ